MNVTTACLKVKTIDCRKTHLLKFFSLILFVFLFTESKSQQIAFSKEQILAFTSQWKGERFADGRPKVSDSLVKRLANISIEEAWQVMRNEGYNNQFEAGWQIIHPEKVLAGRVVTAQYMPSRPDIDKVYEILTKLGNLKILIMKFSY